MVSKEAILQQWVPMVMEGYSSESRSFLLNEPDRFRNPTGSLIRESLELLLSELFGEMDMRRTSMAVGALMRLQALQTRDVTESSAFLSGLSQLLEGLLSEADLAACNQRIDLFKRLADEEFLRCHQHLAGVRENEKRRALAVPVAIMRERSL